MGVLIAVCSSRAHDVSQPASACFRRSHRTPSGARDPSLSLSACLSPPCRAPRGRRAAARGSAGPAGVGPAGRPASSRRERGIRAADAHRHRVPGGAVVDRAARSGRAFPPSPRRHGATGPAHPVPGIRRTCASGHRDSSGLPAGQSHSMLPPIRPGSGPRQDRRSAQCTGQHTGGNPYSAAASDVGSDPPATCLPQPSTQLMSIRLVISLPQRPT